MSDAAQVGNEYVNVAQALAHAFRPETMSYTERDVSLYALSIGSAESALDPLELQYVYELNNEGFYTFPTFGVTFPFTVLGQIGDVKGLTFNPMLLLHGEQYLEVARPIPTTGTVTTHARITDIFDKGSGALVQIELVSKDELGATVALNRTGLFIRGIGNFGGERGPSGAVNVPPDRAPDATFSQTTQPNQALLYRLSSGDRNPLHADPHFAALGGFDRPILHGLCTFGFGVRAVVRTFADNDPTRFKSVQARFAKHVFPGETLRTEMWAESPTRIVFRMVVAERDEVVLSNAVVELFAEEGEVAEEAISAESQPYSAKLFDKIGERIAQHPEWVERVDAIFQFDIQGEEGGQYVVDLRNAPGRVYAGTEPEAGCTMIAAIDDFVAMLKGELKPEKAFLSGKLKVEGNILLATKLGPLFSEA